MTNTVVRNKAVWGPKRIVAAALALAVLAAPGAAAAAGKKPPDRKAAKIYKLDGELQKRALRTGGRTQVIIELKPGYDAAGDLTKAGGRLGRKLSSINGQVAEVPNSLLRWLEKHPGVVRVNHDRPAAVENYRTAVTTGARAARWEFGYEGQGIGVAVIDSGVTSWHNDLTGIGAYGYQRVSQFVDFVNGQALPYDDNGHGTHVAGIIGGNGYDSLGYKAGIAPQASIVALKVLDGNGQGTISNIIAALDWVVANKDAYNIRVANLSLGAGVYESYWTDPLTQAAKRAVDAGVVVVASGGNLGRNAAGQTQYGAVTAPGNAPWVLTIGASSTMGTLTRTDDTVAGYSSRGPTFIDFAAKPDLLAPGTGTVSLSDPASLFYGTKAQYLVNGSTALSYLPYLSLSGTSMAAPVVTGSAALMLQANPALTPNAVKAILQYTAQLYPSYDFLTQGAGFLNTAGAVRLSRFLATMQPGDVYPTRTVWAKHIIWGNQRLSGGYILLDGANAWGSNIVWGNAFTDAGDNIVWGNECGSGDCDNIVWGNAGGDDNIVWGNSVDAFGNIVWGNAGGDNIVWGNDCAGADCDNIVWGNVDDDNIVWGNAADGDNIVWGNSCQTLDTCDNIVWGNSDGDNIVWGNIAELDVMYSDTVDPAEESLTFEELFAAPPPASAPPPAEPTDTTTTTADSTVPGGSL